MDERFQAQAAAGGEAYLQTVRYQARVAPMVDVLAAGGLAIVMYSSTAETPHGTDDSPKDDRWPRMDLCF